MSRYRDELDLFFRTYPDAIGDIVQGLRVAADLADGIGEEVEDDVDRREILAEAASWANLADELDRRAS